MNIFFTVNWIFCFVYLFFMKYLEFVSCIFMVQAWIFIFIYKKKREKGMNFYPKYSKLVVDLCGQEMIKNLVLLSILLLWKLLNFSKIYVIEIKILCD